jgi:hypothetical protein
MARRSQRYRSSPGVLEATAVAAVCRQGPGLWFQTFTSTPQSGAEVWTKAVKKGQDVGDKAAPAFWPASRDCS